jgi:hypothetical protein
VCLLWLRHAQPRRTARRARLPGLLLIDDPVQNNNPTWGAGRNAVSLNDGREAFSRDGFARAEGRGEIRPPEPDEIPPEVSAESS